jgi:hypothetical protein
MILLFSLLLLCAGSANTQSGQGAVLPTTDLVIRLDIYEIKIKNIRESVFDTEGEFYFKRRLLGDEVRLPSSGNIHRKKNQYIRPTDTPLASEVFWFHEWTEQGTEDRSLRILGYEVDLTGDDEMGTVRADLELNNFGFLQKYRDCYLETDDFRVHLNVSCAPVITSQSHPDSSSVYDNNDVSMAWGNAMPSLGILGYSYILDEVENSEPDDVLEGTHTSNIYHDLSSGVWWFHVKAKDKAGYWSDTGHFRINIKGTVDVKQGDVETPDFLIHQNYPNPFNSGTVIPFQIVEDAHTKIVVYNCNGQYVKTLVDAWLTKGVHQVRWEGRDEAGIILPSGIYLARCKSSDVTRVIRMTMIR